MVSNLIMDISGDTNISGLVEADRWNENGYYENKEFVILNNSILIGEFSVSSMFLRYPPEKRNGLIRIAMSISNLNYSLLMLYPGVIHKRASRRQVEMTQLARRFPTAIVKDPRFTLLIKEWQRATGIRKALFCFRSPYEVARSLRKRNLIPMVLGYQLWEFHTRQFLDNIGEMQVTYVNHDNFFRTELQQSEIRNLYQFLDLPFDERKASEVAGRIINTSLRHYAYRGEKIPSRTASLYQRLITLHAQNPANSADS